jgi:hypothetical protein
MFNNVAINGTIELKIDGIKCCAHFRRHVSSPNTSTASTSTSSISNHGCWIFGAGNWTHVFRENHLAD